jgi:hypothetical protein
MGTAINYTLMARVQKHQTDWLNENVVVIIMVIVYLLMPVQSRLHLGLCSSGL